MTQDDRTISRRTLGKVVGSAAAFAALQQSLGERVTEQAEAATSTPTTTVGMLLYPRFTALDLIGPQYLLSFLPDRTTQLLWKNRDVIVSDSGVPIQPTMTFAEAPKELEFIFVPGGTDGAVAAMEDPEILDFLATHGDAWRRSRRSRL